MAVHWSWAFGAETNSQLSTYFDWTFNVTTGVQEARTGAGNEYTYSGAPAKYSWATSTFRNVEIPVVLPSVGSLAGAIKVTDAWRADSGSWLFGLIGTTDGDSIRMYMSNTGDATGQGAEVTCRIINNTVGTFTINAGEWNYLAIVYTMNSTTFTADFYLNGVLQVSGTNAFAIAQAGATIKFGGYTGTGVALNAQFISYDSGTSGADAATPYYVSRIPPNSDNAGTVGTWTPTSGTDDFAVTNENPYDNATFTQDLVASSNNNCTTEINNLVDQLGVSGTTVISATNHTLSTGNGFSAHASIRDSNGSFVDGDSITPDSTTADYAFATVSSGLSEGSVIECKYEVD